MRYANPDARECSGFHRFTDDTGAHYGSFEVFYSDTKCNEPGWYWWSALPGCLPDGERVGPFKSSREAFNDARNL